MGRAKARTEAGLDRSAVEERADRCRCLTLSIVRDETSAAAYLAFPARSIAPARAVSRRQSAVCLPVEGPSADDVAIDPEGGEPADDEEVAA